MLRTRLLTGPGLFPTLEGDWQELAGSCPGATPFQTHEWQSLWYRHYGSLKKPIAFAFYEGHDLVGLYPMTRSVGPWRTLRPMGVGPSDYLHPLIRTGCEAQVAPLLADQLSSTEDADLVDLHQVREGTDFAARAEGSVVEQATCLLLDLPESYDAYLGMLGKSLRYDVRKLDKSMFKEGKATIEDATVDSVDQALEILFEQHRKRWRKRGLPGAFLGRSQSFHREWARIAAAKGWLRLGTLRLEGNPIGAIYVMAFGDTAFYYQAGFDPVHSSISPGTLMVAQAIRRAIDTGARHFDFMRGDEPYKRRWKPQHVLRNLRFIAPGRGAMGRLGTQWNMTGSRLEGRVRARLEGKGLL